MYADSSDSDAYFSATQKIERYLAMPSPHDQEGGALYDQDEEMGAEDASLPVLNASQPDDFEGSPVSSEQYVNIPLPPEFDNVLAVKIKRTAFLRQKASYKVYCCVFCPCGSNCGFGSIDVDFPF